MSAPGFAALLLAAGRSTRMGGPNKLVQDYRGRPLVRYAAEAALAAGADPVVVVTGHQEEAVAAALAGLAVRLVPNPAFAAGLSTSLKAGAAVLAPTGLSVMVMLGDMPLVAPSLLRALAAALERAPGRLAAVPVLDGEWGNPVLLAPSLVPRLQDLTGDAGARRLLQGLGEAVLAVPVTDAAVALDIDTPESLARLRES